MRVKFWGTRGSIAKPGPSTVRYGGNTSCVEVRSAAGTLVVLDCGTGAHALGHALQREAPGATRGHILISHTHWDHIQGLPFFAPLLAPGGEWDIYGPKGLLQSLREVLAGQMEHVYFPVALDQLGARIRYHDLVEGEFRIGDVRVSARYLNHPGLTLGYRLHADGASVVYSCDHEPHFTVAATGDCELTGPDARHVEFLAGADVVIHDAQYLAEEFPARTGWGHSSAEYAVRACCQAGARKLVLTHHDPSRDDDAVDRLLAAMRLRATGSLEVFAAAEGELLHVSARGEAASRHARAFPARASPDSSLLARPMLIRMDDEAARDVLLEAASQEGLPRPVILREGDPLPRISAEDYALVVLRHSPPFVDAVDLARRLRAAEGAPAVRVPIAIVAEGDAASRAGCDAATDWMAAPLSLSYARTKIRSWQLRTACRRLRASSDRAP